VRFYVLFNLLIDNYHLVKCLCVSEQVLFPLHFVNKLCEVDFEASVSEGGIVGQAGAIRLGLSKALLAVVDADTAEKMRLGVYLFILLKYHETRRQTLMLLCMYEIILNVFKKFPNIVPLQPVLFSSLSMYMLTALTKQTNNSCCHIRLEAINIKA